MSQNSKPNPANKPSNGALPQLSRANRQAAPVFDEEEQEEHLAGDEEAEEEEALEADADAEAEGEEEEDSRVLVQAQKPPDQSKAPRPDRLPRIEPLFPDSRETKPVTGSTLNEAKLPRGFESDQQFQKYLSTLTEYDRSRYQQLLEKNKTLKEELRKIAKQTEEVLRKEKYPGFTKRAEAQGAGERRERRDPG